MSSQEIKVVCTDYGRHGPKLLAVLTLKKGASEADIRRWRRESYSAAEVEAGLGIVTPEQERQARFQGWVSTTGGNRVTKWAEGLPSRRMPRGDRGAVFGQKPDGTRVLELMACPACRRQPRGLTDAALDKIAATGAAVYDVASRR